MPQIQYQNYSISTLKGYLYLPSFDYISLPPLINFFANLLITGQFHLISLYVHQRTIKDNKG